MSSTSRPVILPRLRSILLALTLVCVTLAPAVRASAARASGPSGALTVDIVYEQSSLDPAVDYDSGTTYIRQVYDTLVSAVGERQVKIVPNLAPRWEQSSDGKTWTFHLRPGVRFHDGSPVDAAAVKFSFDRLLKAQQGAYADFVEISSVVVVDPHTVRFGLRYPFSSFLASLTNPDGASIVSPKTVGKHKIVASSRASYLDSHDAGSGPYMLVTWQHKRRIVLKAVPGYWRGWSGPHVRTVYIEWPVSSSTQRRALEQGSIDATMNLSAQDFAAVAHERGIVVHEYTAQTIRYILINTAKGALRNKLVRQALSYAFDYDGVILGVFQGHALRMAGIGPLGFDNFVPARHPYTFDLNKARSLLARAGYAGKKLTFTLAFLPGDTQAWQIAQIFRADLARIGITVRLQSIPIAEYARVIQKASTNPDLWIGSWTQDYDDDAPQYWSFFYSGNLPLVGYNVFYYRNPTMDRLLVQARSEREPRAAYRLYQQVCGRAYDEALMIPIAQPTERIAVRTGVHGYQYNYMSGANYYPLYDISKS